MSYRSISLTLVALCAAGCVWPPTPAPTSARAIAVFPANNLTGDPLLIAGASFVEKYVLPTERYTVPDALAAEARVALARCGFNVIAPEVVDGATAGHAPASAEEAAGMAARTQIDAAVLYIEIRRWEPNASLRPSFIIASVAATLIDASTRRVLWTADHPSRPVPTPGVINLGDAYSVAAHTLMTEMLAPASFGS